MNIMPLKVPSGWAISYNHFVDEDAFPDPENPNQIKNWDAFKEDLLQISRLELHKGYHTIKENHLLIDLGWYPEADINGTYKAEVVWSQRKDPFWTEIAAFKSRDRIAIQQKIENWMEALSYRWAPGMSIEQIEKIL